LQATVSAEKEEQERFRSKCTDFLVWTSLNEITSNPTCLQSHLCWTQPPQVLL